MYCRCVWAPVHCVCVGLNKAPRAILTHTQPAPTKSLYLVAQSCHKEGLLEIWLRLTIGNARASLKYYCT